jgi:hypothetical protein
MGDLKIKKIDPSQIRYTPEEGELIQTPEGKYVIWHDGSWNEIKMENGGINMGLYDINKQIISQLPALNDFTKAIADVRDLHSKYWNEYYMMYGKEISYFTLFKVCGMNEFGQDVIDCCANIGVIKAMDMTEAADAIEIWIQSENDEPTCLYLFPYDNGVVQVGE